MSKYSKAIEAMKKFSQELKQKSRDNMETRFETISLKSDQIKHPWDDLDEEQLELFNNIVKSKFESELRKDRGNIMTYQQTRQWVWDNGGWGGS